MTDRSVNKEVTQIMIHFDSNYFPLAMVLGFLFLASERLLVRWRHSSKVTGSEAVDGGTFRLLWLIVFLSITGALVVAYWPLGPRLPAGIPWWMVSLVVFVSGTALRWWAIFHLGRFFTVDITLTQGHRVVDDGPYRHMRHPSYTGLLMQFVGWALSLNSVLALPVALVPIFFSLLHRIRAEEAVLNNALGADYTTYSLRTKRLIPWIY